MNYADELVSMLRPLGVYSFQEGSFSLAELQALGAALDAADEAFGAAQKESIVMTAQDEGLSKMGGVVPEQASGENRQMRGARQLRVF